MMTLTKQIFIAIALILFSSVIYAQKEIEDATKSIVVLSEDDITSLVNTLRKYKKEKAINSTYNLEFDSIESEASYNNSYLKSQLEHLNRQKPVYGSSEDHPNSALLARRLNALENEMIQLNYAIKQLSAFNKDVVTSALPQNEQNRTISVPQTPYVKDTASLNINADERLQRQLDSLSAVIRYIKLRKNEPARIIAVPQTVYVKDTASLNNKADERLQRQLDSLSAVFKNKKQPANANYAGDFMAIQERIDALKKSMQDKNNTPSNYDVLSSKYKGYNKVIYFADNSKTLNLNASNIIEELFTILDSNENIDLIVKGFASNKGNAIYNENLSMQRTEAVKKGLMLRGIHPARVLTQYHGIDYNTPKEAEARRVEVSVLVRK